MALINKINLSEIENFKDLSPEFYRAEYMTKSASIRKNKFRRLSQISYITDGEHGSPCWSDSSGIKYVTAEFIKENFIEQGITKQITFDQDRRNARARLKEGDILIYSVGAYAGYTCVAEPHLFPANIPRSVAIVRLNNNDEFYPEFISVFLNSNIGKFQSVRFRAGNSQPVLALEKIRQFEVPIFDEKIQREIKFLYQEAYKLRQQSQTLYKQATDLLEQEIGLDKISFEKPKSYTANFSDLINAKRSDAEFFDVKFSPLLERVKNHNNSFRLLRNISDRVLPNFIKIDCHDTKINYIEIGDIKVSYGIFESNSIYTKNAPANAKIKLTGGEILISMVRPTRGAIAIVPDVLTDITTIASGAFYVLKIKDLKKREIVWLYFRLIKDLFEKYCGGSSYPTIDSRYISSFPVPCFDEEISNKISTLITESTKSQKKSQQLLAEAKARVEQLIEEAANNA